MAVEATAFARAGLIGNPSDGYFGKTISISVRNFAAKVSLYENAEIEIIPSFQDRSKYSAVHDLVDDVRQQGYYGGIRLMKATVKKFVEYCDENRIPLHNRNFSLRYRSTIPRRVGLAGSSALVTATLRCLLEFYEVDLPKPEQPNLILSVENEELGISAGLQDRVIQVYEGCVYMDFDKAIMEREGHGIYEEIDPRSLPNLFIAYRSDLGEGSEVFHNNIKQRWLNGDKDVLDAMQGFAALAQEARDALRAGRGDEIGSLMDRNFDLRRSISNLDPRNIEMVERARSVGASGKFAGSGGAIVGTYKDEAMFEALNEVFQGTSTVVFKPDIS
jgi:glucuronokinase